MAGRSPALANSERGTSPSELLWNAELACGEPKRSRVGRWAVQLVGWLSRRGLAAADDRRVEDDTGLKLWHSPQDHWEWIALERLQQWQLLGVRRGAQWLVLDVYWVDVQLRSGSVCQVF